MSTGIVCKQVTENFHKFENHEGDLLVVVTNTTNISDDAIELFNKICREKYGVDEPLTKRVAIEFTDLGFNKSNRYLDKEVEFDNLQEALEMVERSFV